MYKVYVFTKNYNEDFPKDYIRMFFVSDLEDSTIKYYIERGFEIMVEKFNPIRNLYTKDIRTDKNGIGFITKKEEPNMEEEKERIVKISLSEDKFQGLINYLIKQNQNQLAGELFFGVVDYEIEKRKK